MLQILRRLFYKLQARVKVLELVGLTPSWGSIIGTLSGQTDLQAALNLKANAASPAFTGTPSGVITSGTYTPTLTNTTNIDASTPYEAQWMRIGNVVTVSGKVDIDATLTATLTRLDLSLPVASDFGAQEDCAGTASTTQSATPEISSVLANTASNIARFSWFAIGTGNLSWYYCFQYQII